MERTYEQRVENERQEEGDAAKAHWGLSARTHNGLTELPSIRRSANIYSRSDFFLEVRFSKKKLASFSEETYYRWKKKFRSQWSAVIVIYFPQFEQLLCVQRMEQNFYRTTCLLIYNITKYIELYRIIAQALKKTETLEKFIDFFVSTLTLCTIKNKHLASRAFSIIFSESPDSRGECGRSKTPSKSIQITVP